MNQFLFRRIILLSKYALLAQNYYIGLVWLIATRKVYGCGWTTPRIILSKYSFLLMHVSENSLDKCLSKHLINYSFVLLSDSGHGLRMISKQRRILWVKTALYWMDERLRRCGEMCFARGRREAFVRFHVRTKSCFHMSFIHPYIRGSKTCLIPQRGMHNKDEIKHKTIKRINV